VTNRVELATGPAEAVREALAQAGWSQVDLALMWGVSQGLVSMLVGGQRSITPRVALRLEATVGGSAAAWMDLQRDWDLHEHRRRMASELAEIAERRRELGL
jgi:addiction module HigA family antidote